MEVIRPDDIDVLWADILQERRAQDAQWGGPAHDDEHTEEDWVSFIDKFLTRVDRDADDAFTNPELNPELLEGVRIRSGKNRRSGYRRDSRRAEGSGQS